jgi:ribonucleotide reductase alpha subunit
LKRNIKKRSSAALYINLFKQKVDGAIKTIDQKVVQNLMGGLIGTNCLSVNIAKGSSEKSTNGSAGGGKISTNDAILGLSDIGADGP